MDDQQFQFKLARDVEKRFLQYKQFWNDLMQHSDILNKEESSMCDKLSKLNFEINDLQISKTKLDELKCTLETDVEDITEKTKHYEFIKTHFEALNQRKHLLEEYSLTKVLELEENTLNDKLNNVWKYFNYKNTKLDDEIKGLESKLAYRQDLVSKMFEKEYNQYKKSIQKLKDENSVLSKKLSLISKIG